MNLILWQATFLIWFEINLSTSVHETFMGQYIFVKFPFQILTHHQLFF